MESSLKPPKPQRIILGDEKGGQWEVLPNVEIYTVTELEPENEEQEKRAKEFGKVVRVVYCAQTYEMACRKVEALLKEGKRPERIECIFAMRDTVQAIFSGKARLVPLGASAKE